MSHVPLWVADLYFGRGQLLCLSPPPHAFPDYRRLHAMECKQKPKSKELNGVWNGNGGLECKPQPASK